MTVLRYVERARQLVDHGSRRLAWLPPMLARLGLGVVFVQTGWGKLHSLEQVTAFFRELGIPAAHLQAPLVAGIEFVGGLLLIAGLATRLSAALLMGTMVVAIVTAQRGNIHGLGDLFGLLEFAYVSLFLWIAAAGPGPISLDRLIGRALAARGADGAGGASARAQAAA
jgi:putative oxidoreductase